MALANKMVRWAWAMLTKGVNYRALCNAITGILPRQAVLTFPPHLVAHTKAARHINPL